MNFDLLSKNAVSYSSASIIKYFDLVNFTEFIVPDGSPPIR